MQYVRGQPERHTDVMQPVTAMRQDMFSERPAMTQRTYVTRMKQKACAPFPCRSKEKPSPVGTGAAEGRTRASGPWPLPKGEGMLQGMFRKRSNTRSTPAPFPSLPKQSDAGFLSYMCQDMLQTPYNEQTNPSPVFEDAVSRMCQDMFRSPNNRQTTSAPSPMYEADVSMMCQDMFNI